jgi:hypothetical protein
VSRYDRRRRAGTVNRELGAQSVAAMRRQDEMAELAERWVAACIGADPGPIDARRPDRGYDLIVPATGARLDVKWTHTRPGERFGARGIGYPTLNLWIAGKRHRADLYAMVCGECAEDFDRYAWAHGWATRAEALAAPIDPGIYGRPYHALGFDYLHPLDELAT